MAADLVDLHERIRWARGKIVVLGAEINQFISSGGVYQITHELSEGGGGTFYIQALKLPPKHLAIEAGSIAHELRATLDNLACVLAERNGQNAKDVYFAISKTEAIFRTDGLKRKLKKLSEADRNALAALKPYSGGNAMLFALHEMDLTRKHQRLLMTASGMQSLGIGTGTITSLEMLGTGQVTSKPSAFMRLGEGTHVHIDLGVDLTLAEPEHVAGRPVVAALQDFSRLVESIVEIFD